MNKKHKIKDDGILVLSTGNMFTALNIEEISEGLAEKISEDPNEKLVEIIDEQVDHILVRIEGSNKNIKRLLDLVGKEPIEKICDEISKEVHNIKSYRKMISRLKQYIDDLDEEIAEERKCE